MAESPLPGRIARLRSASLDVLEEMVGEGLSAHPALAGAVADLQEVVNRLAAAQTILSTWQRDEHAAWAEAGTNPRPSQDAAIVLALAATTVPLAVSPWDEAERWVRVLRLHGRVGAALEELGVALAPLDTMADPVPPGESRQGSEPTEVAEIALRAERVSRARRAETLDTVDVLFAVADVHGTHFERALYARGTTLAELLERLPAAQRTPAQT
jgi:hypothetical protein